MRVDSTSRNSNVGKKGDARKSGGGQAFVIGEEEAEAPKAASMTGSGPVAGIEAMLALQGVDEQNYANRRTAKRGHTLLNTLEEIKAGLLMGRLNEGKLQFLMKTITQARVKADPDLDALVDEIELRARVELAKLGRFPSI